VEVEKIEEIEKLPEGVTSNSAINEIESSRERVLQDEDRPGIEGFGLKVLGELEVPNGNGTVTREYFFSEKPEFNIKPVYHHVEISGQEPRYEIERLYPYRLTKEEIMNDLTGKEEFEWVWPEGVPSSETYVEEEFITEEDTDLSNFIVLTDGCKRYMGGDECSVSVLTNQYGLTPGRLEQSTGPFEWSRAVTLSEIRVMNSGKLFLVWGFGDGGARSFSYSVWDTSSGEHGLISSYGGMLGEVMSITTGAGENKKQFRILTAGDGFEIPDGTIDVFELYMFGELPSVLFQDPPPYCIEVTPIPKDRTDPSAPWLLEYSYGCYEAGYNLAFRYFELDPVTENVEPVSELLYR
jgi:hypothetical protein